MNIRAPWRKTALPSVLALPLAPLALLAVLAGFTMDCGDGDGGGGSGGSGGGSPLGQPAMVMAVLAEPTVVVVSWRDNASAEMGFLIERQAGAGEFREVGRTAANVTEFRDTTVSRGRSYLYRVAALDQQGMGTGFGEEAIINVPQ